MDIFVLLFMAVVSVLFGIVLTLVIQYYVLIKFFNKEPIVPAKNKINHEAYCLPEGLKKSIDEDGLEKSADSSLPISLVLQFLFHELRHSDVIKRWLYKKLSMEFDELLTKTTIGKFFETVTIKDMNLGNEFPDIQSLKLDNIKLDKNEGHIDTLNLSVKVDYSGNFMLSVDAKMKFGKTAHLSIKVKRVSGLARLQFTRLPYTHWSLSFYSEPSVEVAVESRLGGRQLQAHVHGLVAHQIKKAIRRKHTLPNYKIRYRPFFVKTDPGCSAGDDVDDEEAVTTSGKLEVTCAEISRLAATDDVVKVYCTFAVSDIAWVSLVQNRSDSVDSYTMVADVTVRRNCDKQRTLGAGFRAAESNSGCSSGGGVIVDVVDVGGAASRAGLRPVDHVLAVEGRTVTTASVTQVARLIRASPSTTICLRIQRKVLAHCLLPQELDTVTSSIHTEPTITISSSDGGSATATIDSGSINTLPSTGSVPVAVDVSSANSSGTITDGSFVMVEHDGIEAVNVSIVEPKRKTTSDRLTSRGLLHSGNESVAKIAAHTFGSLAALRKRKSVSLERNTNISGGGGGGGSASTSSTSPSPASASAQSTPQHRSGTSTVQQQQPVTNENEKGGKEIEMDLSGDVISFQETKRVELCSAMQMKDEFVFDVKDGYKFLNINVWGTTKNTDDILLGYTNILLSEVLSECRTSMLGHYIKRYWFLPPNNTTPTIQSHPLMSHSGFEHVFCYGDILVSFVWSVDLGAGTGAGDMGRKLSASSACDGEQGDSGAALQGTISGGTKTTASAHDFIRTQFHRSVHCDFCSKRIWLKDAVQCRECGLCCHRKCVTRCQQGGTACVSPSPSSTGANSNAAAPEIITTEPTDCTNMSGSGVLKRVNSANNLLTLLPPHVPGATPSASLSLPPSPQRRRSLVQEQAAEPFALCPLVLQQIFEGGGIEAPDARDTLERVLEQVMQWPADDLLMAAAKETGKQMYSNLGVEERAEKIGAMMSALKRVFDTSTEEHAELQRSLGVSVSSTNNVTIPDAASRTRAAFLLGQADAKMHALSVLMLHYCSALQQTHDKII